jgi:hypothetical protein
MLSNINQHSTTNSGWFYMVELDWIDFWEDMILVCEKPQLFISIIVCSLDDVGWVD